MSVHIEVSRHFAETLALAVVGVGMLGLIWGVSFLCTLLLEDSLSWLTRCISTGAWLIAAAGMAGIYYLGANHFNAVIYVVYAIIGAMSIAVTLYRLLKDTYPPNQPT